jgi:hypothetical protein
MALRTGYAENTAFIQAWLNGCEAVTDWWEIDNGFRIEFRYDDRTEVEQVPQGVQFAGDEA